MKNRWRVIGLVTVLVLAFALVPAVAMAAAPITQGIQGAVRDAVTGVPIPFARVHIDYSGGGHIVDLTADWDGTYSFALDPDDYWMEASSSRHLGQSFNPVTVATDTVTTQDFSLVHDPIAPYQPIYRFFNMKGGVHFYTASDEEFINVYGNLSSVFHYDGVAYAVPWGTSEDPDLINPNTFPLYRFFNRHTGVHFYTMSEAEKANVIATRGDDYIYEGVAYWVSDGSVFATPAQVGEGEGLPIYRFYVPSRDAHFFTANNGEVLADSQLSNYYHYEGIGFYIDSWRSVETDTLVR